MPAASPAQRVGGVFLAAAAGRGRSRPGPARVPAGVADRPSVPLSAGRAGRAGLGVRRSLALSAGIHVALVGSTFFLGIAAPRLGEERARGQRLLQVPPPAHEVALLEPPPPERLEAEPREEEPWLEPEPKDVPWQRAEEHRPEREAPLEDRLFDPDPFAGDLSWSLGPAAAEAVPSTPAPPPLVALPAAPPPRSAPAQPAEAPETPRAEEALLAFAPPPDYPPLAFRRGEEGAVLCRLHVSDEGLVTRVEVVGSSGFRRLDEAACRKLAEWRFRPRRELGRAVPTTVLHEIVFRIEA